MIIIGKLNCTREFVCGKKVGILHSLILFQWRLGQFGGHYIETNDPKKNRDNFFSK